MYIKSNINVLISKFLWHELYYCSHTLETAGDRVDEPGKLNIRPKKKMETELSQ